MPNIKISKICTRFAFENDLFESFKLAWMIFVFNKSIELSGLAPFSQVGFRDVIQNQDADRL